MWQCTDTQKGDLWEDGRPADYPVFGNSEGGGDVLRSVERRHLCVERVKPGADRAGSSWGAWVSSFYFLNWFKGILKEKKKSIFVFFSSSLLYAYKT